MGSLTPGVPLIYESPDNGVTIYSREFGKPEKTLVGQMYNKHDSRTNDGRPLHDHVAEQQLWHDIRITARTNPALQDCLDRAIIVYNLSKVDTK